MKCVPEYGIPIVNLFEVIQISDVDVANQTFKCYLRCYLDWPATLEECKQFWMRDQDAYSVISMGENTAAGSFLSFQPWTKFFVVSQENSIARDWAGKNTRFLELSNFRKPQTFVGWISMNDISFEQTQNFDALA